MQAAERRKQEQGQLRTPAAPGLPSMPQQSPQQHSHQPPPNPMGLSAPQPPLPLHSNAPRPSLDRSHTFPTPPASASGVMPNIGNSDHFGWQGQGMNGPQGKYPNNPEDDLMNQYSLPFSPATTPPSSVQPMQPYSGGAHGYDVSRSMYSAPGSQQSPYQNTATPQDRMYGQSGGYPKSEMAPPSNRPSVSGPAGEQVDNKPTNGVNMSSEPGSQPHNGEEEGDHEHGQEYTHDSGAYDAQRNTYNYNAPSVGAMAQDHSVPSDVNGSPSHHPASGRATPRTTAPSQSYYQQQHTGYSTPPRVQQTSSTLYNVMSNDRAPTNGNGGSDVYAPAADMAHPMSNGYAPQPPLLNGGSMKRGREDDDELPRPSSGGPGSINGMDLKRRKTMLETSVAAPAYDAMSRPASALTAPRGR